MHIKRFLKIGRILAIIFSLTFIFSCKDEKKSQHILHGTKWLEEITINDLQKGYATGKFTVTDVVKAYLDRIDSLDENGPALNAVICLNPDAMVIAKELDSILATGKPRGALFGVPVLLKDNIDTHDKMPNTAGSLALMKSLPLKDSYVASQLRKAGAIILGKTNLSEWANFRSSISSSGWSGLGGQTKNPYFLDRNPCGSSSGSGVAVSANFCTVAIGTETNGSIVCPANNNGIVGLKPTVGLISRTGIIPISFTQDTPGPMARTVEDAAICLNFLTNSDPNDSKTTQYNRHVEADYTKFLNKDGLKGKRIGILSSSTGFHPRVDSVFNKKIAWMKSQGAIFVEIKDELDDKIASASFEIMLFEYKDGLNKYFASLGKNTPIRTITDLIAFNKKHPEELRYFDQQILEKAAMKGNLESPEYKKLLSVMQKGIREECLDRIFVQESLDALVAPTGTPAWKTDLLLGDLYLGGTSSWAAISGYPTISVPMGFIDGLPVGISFIGKAWQEGPLINTGYFSQKKTGIFNTTRQLKLLKYTLDVLFSGKPKSVQTGKLF
jgi:amidase